jgi:hypothetical protein
MRKKLLSLGFALAALAATYAVAPASADPDPTTCPKNSHLIVCPDSHSFCCPNNAFCVCAP